MKMSEYVYCHGIKSNGVNIYDFISFFVCLFGYLYIVCLVLECLCRLLAVL